MKNPRTNFAWHALGGLGEVGMNCMVFEFGETIVPVDAGILFADANDFGIESLFPDYTRLIQQHAPKVWIITHAHEDHIGAIPYLMKKYEELGVPPPLLYAPPFAAALIREKLNDPHKITGGGRFTEFVREFSRGDVIPVGEVLVKPIPIRHSTADTFSLAFEWKQPGQELRIVHTADFKIDEKTFEDGAWSPKFFDVFDGKPVDIMFVDSTNSEREGHSVSELDITAGLKNLVNAASGRVFVTLFSSNVYRMANLMRLARDEGRAVCLAGRSLQTAYRIAQETMIFDRDCPNFAGVQILDQNEINERPRDKQLVICSGSQGEHRSALMRLATAQHPNLVLSEGDTVIFSSKTIPGNEKGVSRIINALLRGGAQVHHGDAGKIHAGGPIHASGHARRGEIARLLNHIKPRTVVPVHGELRQLMSCADVAKIEGEGWGLTADRIHVVENGCELRFGNATGAWELDDKILLEPQARMLKFDQFLSPSRDPFLRSRKKAATGGIVSALLDAAGRAWVKTYGVTPAHLPVDELELERWLGRQYAGLRRSDAFQGDDRKLEEELAEELARFVRRLTGIRPFVVVHLVPL